MILCRERIKIRATGKGASVDGERRVKEKGFTLVEVVLVVAILGILAAVVSISVVGLMGHGEEEAFDTDERTIQMAVSTFYADAHAYAAGAGGWNETGSYTSVHNYPTRNGKDSELYDADATTEVNGYSVKEIIGFSGSTPLEKRTEIENAAIWMGLLVNGPGEGTNPDSKDNSAPLGEESGPYLNPLPESCSHMNISNGSGTITWVVGAYGRVYGTWEQDGVWYTGYGGRYP